MRPETADTLSIAFDKAVVEISGGSDLKTSVTEIVDFLERLIRHLKQCASVEDVRQSLLQMDEPPAATVRLVEGTLRLAPKLVARWLRTGAKQIAVQATSPGRPTVIPTKTYRAICFEISNLELRGRSHAQAKKIIAKKYGVNSRTVHRIWANRSDYLADPVTTEEAQLFMSSVMSDSPMVE